MITPRVGDVTMLRGTVRTVEQIAPEGHLRVTLDIAPPKPEEPTGLGAVVEDAKGHRWVRSGELGYPNADDWHAAGISDHEWRTYADIDAVRVLSPGVSDA